MNKSNPTWIHVVAFKEGDRPMHLSLRLTKQGKVNRHDVNKWLRDTGYTVPRRYLSYGIRTLNPDVVWPEWCVYKGDPPEECSPLLSRDTEAMRGLRARMLEHHPSKMTPEEIAWFGDLARRMANGPPISEEDLAAYRALLDDIASRPIDIDEW
jgi:hypothetical protein